jgi:hypothetical protein
MYFGPVRKGLDFLQKEWRYEQLSGQIPKLSNPKKTNQDGARVDHSAASHFQLRDACIRAEALDRRRASARDTR